jgi:apolipoprotein N-acyltransferase
LNDLTGLTLRRARLALAILAGLLLAAAFPKIGVAGFAWIAPGVMLAAAAGVDGRRAFRLGYLAGFVHYLISLYWLLHIPVNKIAPVTAWLLLSGYLALFSATWVWLCWRMCPGTSKDRGPGISGAFDRLVTAGWMQRVSWAISCAALWVTWEMVQGRLFTGFPWNLLGASQAQMLPIIQVASFTGVYGVSFLAVWFAVSVLCAVAVLLRRVPIPKSWSADVLLPLLAIVGVVTVGFSRVTRPSDSSASLKVALVQPSIPQQWVWEPEESARRFQQLLQLSETALTNKPDLLVWPEAAVPGLVRLDTNIYQAVTSLVRRHKVWLVLGADDAAPRENASDPFKFDSFNSSFLINPEGEFAAAYRKRRLVIFGEYIPLVRWLPFLERWTGMGSFTPGTGPVTFVAPDLQLKTSVLICFEDVFPHLVREYVEDDTDFLLNLTNNGWFGESAAQWQHAASAVFRAVENGLPLVRCANNGLTCWVDAQGRMKEVYFPGTKDVYGPGFKIVEVPLLDRKRPPTFYRRHGDLFGWSCVAWSALAVGRTFLWRRAR